MEATTESMDIQKLFNEELLKINDSGFIRETIKKNLEKTIESIMSDTFRSYSKFGENLKKHIETNLDLSLENLKVSDYNQAVLDIIKQTLETTALSNSQKLIESQICKITGLLEKKEWKLSEIIDKLREEVLESADDDDESGELTLIVEKRHRSHYIYIDKEEGVDKYRCEYQLALDCGREDGLLWSLEINQKAPTIQDFDSSRKYGFGGFLFNLYANKVKIEVDESKCDLYWSKCND